MPETAFTLAWSRSSKINALMPHTLYSNQSSADPFEPSSSSSSFLSMYSQYSFLVLFYNCVFLGLFFFFCLVFLLSRATKKLRVSATAATKAWQSEVAEQQEDLASLQQPQQEVTFNPLFLPSVVDVSCSQYATLRFPSCKNYVFVLRRWRHSIL